MTLNRTEASDFGEPMNRTQKSLEFINFHFLLLTIKEVQKMYLLHIRFTFSPIRLFFPKTLS
jgi:hypothetical protein